MFEELSLSLMERMFHVKRCVDGRETRHDSELSLIKIGVVFVAPHHNIIVTSLSRQRKMDCLLFSNRVTVKFTGPVVRHVGLFPDLQVGSGYRKGKMFWFEC